MNPFVLIFADGTTFFVGLVVVLAAEGILFRFRNRFTRPICTVAAIVGIILVIISATPLPIWAYALWAVPAVCGIVALNRSAPSRRFRLTGVVLLFASTSVLCLMEAPFHRRPALRVSADRTVYVLGDSISAGMGTEHRCWPAVLDDMKPFRVVNLAQPGATVEGAINQAKAISEPNALVIVAIGGNDLLGGTDAASFHSTLDKLVSALRSGQHDFLLLELPLFPFRNAYGMAQRDVVRKHGGSMLPKRSFTRVLGTKQGTLDGLHLSQAGHDAMAEIIAEVLNVQ
ncbi:MAG: SGNH/GDSL hydrolase family protein [Verrucomicrobia bacterium]|nr:SGNH/GDSL hydrolase family protein [Verrucomicrobiota bacterium]MCH8526104.1 SGNH/GDSL hydrolase family protein [Kiritimatiellia bacterium]